MAWCSCKVSEIPSFFFLPNLIFANEFSQSFTTLYLILRQFLFWNDNCFNVKQVHLPALGSHLSTWECGGYFVYNTRSAFDSASEKELSKRLGATSLDDKGFQALKQLCCGIAIKLHPDVLQGWTIFCVRWTGAWVLQSSMLGKIWTVTWIPLLPLGNYSRTACFCL